MKLVSLMLRDNKIYVEAFGRTPDWFWVGLGNVRAVPVQSSREEIGAAILNALSESILDVATPSPPDPLGGIARAAGFNSFASFAKGARSVTVEQNEKGIELVPSTWKGVKMGFVPRVEDSIFAENDSAAGIGEATLKSIELCQ
jgi:hypothetical protein